MQGHPEIQYGNLKAIGRCFTGHARLAHALSTYSRMLVKSLECVPLWGLLPGCDTLMVVDLRVLLIPDAPNSPTGPSKPGFEGPDPSIGSGPTPKDSGPGASGIIMFPALFAGGTPRVKGLGGATVLDRRVDGLTLEL